VEWLKVKALSSSPCTTHTHTHTQIETETENSAITLGDTKVLFSIRDRRAKQKVNTEKI
jgi:hypothetical protein